jgi:hypothetical protein
VTTYEDEEGAGEDDLLDEQAGQGYGEDEGERGESLDDDEKKDADG